MSVWEWTCSIAGGVAFIVFYWVDLTRTKRQGYLTALDHVMFEHVTKGTPTDTIVSKLRNEVRRLP